MNAFDFDDLDDHEEIDLEIFLNIKKHRLMNMDHEKAVDALFRRYGIELFLEYFKNFNPSLDAPYHNGYHSYCVVLNSFEGAYYAKLPDHDIKLLLIAALFHDFDHSAGRDTDDANIERAIKGVYIAQKYAGLRALSGEEFNTVEDLIAVTKYPWDKDPVTTAQMLLRDADLMQIYEEDDSKLYAQYQGLKTEIETRQCIEITTDEFVSKMQEFLNTQVVWYSEWAQKKTEVLNWQSNVDRLRKVLNA